jgi:hypothetical protein
MSRTRIAGFLYTFTDGRLLIVPEERMPFAKEPKKVLADFEAEFYLDSPLYDSMVEIRIDDTESTGPSVDRRLVTIVGRVESRLSRGIEQPWVIAEQIVTHGDVADEAYQIYLRGQGGSPADNWLSAEDALLGEGTLVPDAAHTRRTS